MQKPITPILVLLLALSGCAGSERAEDANKPIEFVLDAPGKTQSQLYSSAKTWVAETFVSGKAVIDEADKDSGRIIAKGRIKRPCKGLDCVANGGNLIGFMLRIDTKDGKIRMTFINPTIIEKGKMIGTSYSPPSEDFIWHKGDMDAAKIAFNTLRDELQHYVDNESVTSKNW